MSKEIDAVTAFCAALREAQHAIGYTVAKDEKNPHFRSSYASLPAVLETFLPAAREHGLTLVQSVVPDGDGLKVVSVLRHDAGHSEESSWPLPIDSNPQRMGSALSYARRYLAVTQFGIAASDEDDDGNGAAGHNNRPPQKGNDRPPPRNPPPPRNAPAPRREERKPPQKNGGAGPAKPARVMAAYDAVRDDPNAPKSHAEAAKDMRRQADLAKELRAVHKAIGGYCEILCQGDLEAAGDLCTKMWDPVKKLATSNLTEKVVQIAEDIELKVRIGAEIAEIGMLAKSLGGKPPEWPMRPDFEGPEHLKDLRTKWQAGLDRLQSQSQNDTPGIPAPRKQEHLDLEDTRVVPD